MDYKSFIGVITVVIALASYVPYFRDIFLGKTKPHVFSWLVWGVLTGIAFGGQLIDNGGAGAWVTGVTSLMCIAVFVLALFKGEKEITTTDRLSLCGAGIALVLWFVIDQPILSVILITIIDLLGFIPTFRKSFHKPHEETVSTYALSATKFAIAFFALDAFTILTVLYTGSLVVMNGLFVIMLMVRRRNNITVTI